jgi:primary-amine oxidase
MKVQKDKILNEADGKIYFRENEKDTYIVVNEDKLDKYGEAPGYRIMPRESHLLYYRRKSSTILTSLRLDGGMHLTIQESDNLFRTQSHATHQLYVTRQHDTEPNAIHAWNNLDPHDPIVEFDKFFNNESLAQEDVVLWYVF